MNTSCKAIFKDGSTKEFASIEEASKETGITVAAIKIRCNKPGCGGKECSEKAEDYLRCSFYHYVISRESFQEQYLLISVVLYSVHNLIFSITYARRAAAYAGSLPPSHVRA